MPKKSRDALGAKGKSDVWQMDPGDVVLVTDKGSALYDERVDNDFKESLVLNMMYSPNGDGVPQGVLKPTLGRRNQETGKVEIIDGRQRTKAAREANKRLKKQGAEPIRLPVILKNANDVRAMAMLVSANEHGTEDSPSAKAKKAQRYIDLGRDEKEVGLLLGVSEATVKNMLKLLDAPAAIRNAADSGKITQSDAYKLSREEPEVAKKKLGQLLEHAPRTPGKKRSKNARKAREIVDGKPAAADAHAKGAPAREDWDTRKVEDRAAQAIAEWIERTWNDEDWDGTATAIPKRIRDGEWREKAKAAE